MKDAIMLECIEVPAPESFEEIEFINDDPCQNGQACGRNGDCNGGRCHDPCSSIIGSFVCFEGRYCRGCND